MPIDTFDDDELLSSVRTKLNDTITKTNEHELNKADKTSVPLVFESLGDVGLTPADFSGLDIQQAMVMTGTKVAQAIKNKGFDAHTTRMFRLNWVQGQGGMQAFEDAVLPQAWHAIKANTINENMEITYIGDGHSFTMDFTAQYAQRYYTLRGTPTINALNDSWWGEVMNHKHTYYKKDTYSKSEVDAKVTGVSRRDILFNDGLGSYGLSNADFVGKNIQEAINIVAAKAAAMPQSKIRYGTVSWYPDGIPDFTKAIVPPTADLSGQPTIHLIVRSFGGRVFAQLCIQRDDGGYAPTFYELMTNPSYGGVTFDSWVLQTNDRYTKAEVDAKIAAGGGSGGGLTEAVADGRYPQKADVYTKTDSDAAYIKKIGDTFTGDVIIRGEIAAESATFSRPNEIGLEVVTDVNHAAISPIDKTGTSDLEKSIRYTADINTWHVSANFSVYTPGKGGYRFTKDPVPALVPVDAQGADLTPYALYFNHANNTWKIGAESISLAPSTRSAAAPKSIPEAPKDGKIYGRKNGKWVEIKMGE